MSAGHTLTIDGGLHQAAHISKGKNRYRDQTDTAVQLGAKLGNADAIREMRRRGLEIETGA